MCRCRWLRTVILLIVEPASQGSHSADRAWWWTGSSWVPALSRDGQWWFNGSTWIPVPPRKRLPRPNATEWGMAVAWLMLWVLGAVLCGVTVPLTNPGEALGPGLMRSALMLGIGSATLLPVCGFVLSRSRGWVYQGILVGYVWALLMMLYVVAMLAAPAAAGSDSDTAAGAGVVILGIPMLLVVGALVGIGAVANLIVGRLSAARTRSSAE